MNMTKNEIRMTKEKCVIKRICHGRLSTIVQTTKKKQLNNNKSDNIINEKKKQILYETFTSAVVWH